MVEMIWLNGMLRAAGAARIDPADRGLLLADGLFETIAVRGGQASDVERHFARLQAGASLLRLSIPLGLAAMARALNETAAANSLEEGGLRLTLTRGPAPRGLLPVPGGQPTLMITGFSLPPPGGPVSVIIAAQVRRDETSPLSKVKALGYLPNILARFEAADEGADDAILLNHAGRAAEATVGNIFVKRGGEWLTPPVSEGALPGICRAKLLQAGLVREAPIEATWLYEAEGLCIGNVLSIRAVARVGGQQVPQAKLQTSIMRL